MKMTVKVERFRQVIQQIQGEVARLRPYKNVSVSVGYNTPYAVKVHEDLAMNHPNGGQAKYLEEPARRLAPTLAQKIYDGLKKGRNLRQVLMTAGLELKMESIQLVPVDTGLLKSTAFVRAE